MRRSGSPVPPSAPRAPIRAPPIAVGSERNRLASISTRDRYRHSHQPRLPRRFGLVQRGFRPPRGLRATATRSLAAGRKPSGFSGRSSLLRAAMGNREARRHRDLASGGVTVGIADSRQCGRLCPTVAHQRPRATCEGSDAPRPAARRPIADSERASLVARRATCSTPKQAARPFPVPLPSRSANDPSRRSVLPGSAPRRGLD